MLINGYAIVFDSPSQNMGNYQEVILPQALNGVKLEDVKLLVNHNHSEPIASVSGKSLKLSVDEKGLFFEAEIEDEDVAGKVERGLFDKMSFGFIERKSSVRNKIKYVEEIESLLEISLVSIPAYAETSALAVNHIEEDSDMLISTRSFDFTASQKNQLEKDEEKMLNTNQAFIEVLKQRNITTEDLNGVANVLAPIFTDEPKGLAANVNRQTITSGSGTMPVLNPNAVLPSTEELAVGADLDVVLEGVRFEAATYRGIIPISQEAIDDAGEGIVESIKRYTKVLKDNTMNARIQAVMAQADAGTAADMNGLRAALYAQPVEANTAVVITQSAYADMVDSVDGASNYQLKEGFFSGFQVHVVSDTAFGGEAGAKQAYVGDLSKIVVLERTNIELDWFNHARYGRMLQPVLRFDVVSTDSEARLITIG